MSVFISSMHGPVYLCSCFLHNESHYLETTIMIKNITTVELLENTVVMAKMFNCFLFLDFCLDILSISSKLRLHLCDDYVTINLDESVVFGISANISSISINNHMHC